MLASFRHWSLIALYEGGRELIMPCTTLRIRAASLGGSAWNRSTYDLWQTRVVEIAVERFATA